MGDFLDEIWRWSDGKWTDDTKMAIALAKSIANAGDFNSERAASSYLAWYDSGDWRGIGSTTQQALANLKEGADWRSSGIKADWAAGNGTAMRVAPIGLLDMRNSAKLREDARNDAIITHNNHEAIQGSIAVAYVISRLVSNINDLRDLIPSTVEFLEPSDILLQLEAAQKLLEQGTPVDDALVELGTSGYVVETVPSALYSFLANPGSFETVVYHAIYAGNDTDTTAAIAGAFAGAHLGIQGIPLSWRTEVEGSDTIRHLAQEIYDLAVQSAAA
jgi:ADP-ribosylglycohydrolase